MEATHLEQLLTFTVNQVVNGESRHSTALVVT